MSSSDYKRTIKIIESASELALNHSHEYVLLEHVMAFLLIEKDIMNVLREIGTDPEKAQNDIMTYLSDNDDIPVAPVRPKRTVMLERVLSHARAQAAFNSKKAIEPIELLLGAVHEENSEGVKILEKNGFRREALIGYLQNSDMFEDIESEQEKISQSELLDRFCVNMNTAQTQNKTNVVQRDQEIDELLESMTRMLKPCSVLTGPSGVGKTAIVEGLAQRINEGNIPEHFEKVQIYSLNLAAVVAGTRYRGEFEERFGNIIKEFENNPDRILFIDEFHQVMGAGSGSSSPMDAANIMKPSLSRGMLRVIACTTDEEFRKHIQKDKAMRRRFHRIHVKEPSVQSTKQILRGLKKQFETHYDVKVPVKILDQTVDLCSRYLPNLPFPDKAIDILDSALAYDQFNKSKHLTLDAIKKKISSLSGIQEQNITQTDTSDIRELSKNLKTEIFGQDKAIDKIVEAYLVSRAGLNDQNKLVLSAVLQGPTGCGKTLLAKKLSEHLGLPLVRFDMSEYQADTSVSRLIGADPNFVGYGDGQAGSGLLANALELNPNCVLLLDEIEKAHPKIFTLLLQALDEGRMNSSSGEVIDFRNIVLLMTTNLGAADQESTDSKNVIGFGRSSVSEVRDTNELTKAMNAFFAPEFRNRLDLMLVFNHLSTEVSSMILESSIKVLTDVLSSRKVKLTVTDSAKAELLRIGFNKSLGARPLARTLNEKIKTPLSPMILFGELSTGGSVQATFEDGQFKFVVKQKKRPADCQG